MPETKPRRENLILLVLCVSIWLLASLLSLWSGSRLRFIDETDYRQLAVHLVQQHAYIDETGQPTVYRPPGYPWVLAALYSVWHSPLAAKLLNAVALGLTGLVLSLLTTSLTNDTDSDGRQSLSKCLAPALILCYPLFFYSASTLYPQTLGTLIFAFCIYLILRTPGSVTRAIIAGLLLGFLVFLIPAFLLLAPVFPAYLVWAGGLKGPSWRNAILLSLCATVVVLPWTVRNYVQFKCFIPVSANSGCNLLLGNSPNTTGNSGVMVDVSEYQRQAEGLDDAQRDKFFTKCAVAYVKQHPGAAFKVYCAKVLNYFNFRNKLFATNENSSTNDIILFLTYYPLLLVAVVRLFLFRRFNFTRPELLLYFFYFGNAFLSAIFFTRIRYRIPFDALLLVLVASFLSRLWAERAPRPESP